MVVGSRFGSVPHSDAHAKVLRYGEPEALASLFSRCADVRDRQTRQDGELRTPRCRTACGQRQFAYRAVKMYSALRTIVTDRPVPSFRHALRCHLAASATHD